MGRRRCAACGSARAAAAGVRCVSCFRCGFFFLYPALLVLRGCAYISKKGGEEENRGKKENENEEEDQKTMEGSRGGPRGRRGAHCASTGWTALALSDRACWLVTYPLPARARRERKTTYAKRETYEETMAREGKKVRRDDGEVGGALPRTVRNKSEENRRTQVCVVTRLGCVRVGVCVCLRVWGVPAKNNNNSKKKKDYEGSATAGRAITPLSHAHIHTHTHTRTRRHITCALS